MPEVARALAGTRRGLWWERLARAFWPAFAWAAAGIAALALGVAAVLGPALPWVVAAWLALLVIAVLAGLIRLRRPRRDAVRARVDSRLPGQPLAALSDAMALGQGDAGAAGLWQAHLAQMRDAARQARPVRGAPGLALRDPFGLRLMALTALAMAVLFGSAAQIGHGFDAVAATFRPMLRDVASADAPAWEGWAQPPEYTRRPVIYLNALPEDEGLTLPKGSRLSFRLYGDSVAIEQDIGTLESAEADTDAGTDADAVSAPVILAERSGAVAVSDRRFPVRVLPDDPPVIRAGPPPQRRADGRLVQQFTASDDNGVDRAEAEITLDLDAVERRYGLAPDPEPRAPVRMDLPLPARNARTEVSGRLTADLARHPLANLPVTIRLRAEDGIGQQGGAEPLHVVLPGRRFFDPLAAALIELRRDLLWSRENAGRVAQILRAVSWQPDDAMAPELYADLRKAADSLDQGTVSPQRRDQISDMLWDAAVRLEDGGLADALAAMERAQQRLSEAIRNGATKDEIARLMTELQKATDDYVRMLAESGETDPSERFVKEQPSQQVTGEQLQAMMDEIERLMGEGRMAEAQQLLDQFARMMQNLKVTQGDGDGDGAGGPRGRLADTLRRQQQLADDAMRDLQRQQSPDDALPGEDGAAQEPVPDVGQPEEPAEGGPEAGGEEGGGDLATRQRSLREGLGAQRELLPGPGTPEGEAARRELERADEAMRRAGDALERGDNSSAMEDQADAIEAMREGLRALGRMQDEDGERGRGAGEQTPDAPPGGGQDSAATDAPRPQTDPLGRELSSSGSGSGITSDDPLADTGVDPAARARDLLDEIRRRSGDRQRPEAERDYLGRLLERF